MGRSGFLNGGYPGLIDGRERLATELFPEVAPPRLSLTIVAAAIASVAALTVAGLLRIGGAGVVDTLYAEDGEIFVTQALHHSTWHALTTPYAGYLHLGPRMITAVVTRAPTADFALGTSVCTALVVAALSLLVYRATAGHVRSRSLRAALAVTIALLPTAQPEVLNNMANLQWYFIAASVLVLLWNPTSRIEVAISCAVLFVTAMSEPLTVLLAPIALARVALVRGWRGRAVVVAMASGIVLQFVGMQLGEATRDGLHADPNPIRVAGQATLHVFGRAIFGMRWLPDGHSITSKALTTAALAIVGTATVFACRRLPEARALLALLALTVALTFAGPTVISGVSAPRYAVVAIVTLLAALVVVLDRAMIVFARERARALALGAGILAVAVLAVNYRVPVPREDGPRWSAGLATARAECARDGARDVVIAIPPQDRKGWHVLLPCDEV